MELRLDLAGRRCHFLAPHETGIPWIYQGLTFFQPRHGFIQECYDNRNATSRTDYNKPKLQEPTHARPGGIRPGF